MASTPIAPESGPTIANETGTPAAEISQSRLATRPSSSDGTSRCSSVYQTMIRTVIDPSEIIATSAACQIEVTTPKPAVISMPSAQAR